MKERKIMFGRSSVITNILYHWYIFQCELKLVTQIYYLLKLNTVISHTSQYLITIILLLFHFHLTITFKLFSSHLITVVSLPCVTQATTCRDRELTLDLIHIFMTTQGNGEPHRMRDQVNAGATSETTWTWMTIHTIHVPINSKKANMEEWLWRPNDIGGSCGPKVSWHLSYKWGKPPKKPHPGNLSRPGIEPRPPAWQHACYLHTVDQIILIVINYTIIKLIFFLKTFEFHFFHYSIKIYRDYL